MDLSKQAVENNPQTANEPLKQEQMATVMAGRTEMEKQNVEQEWQCECGSKNRGKFCVNCGKAKPEVKIQKKCPNCKEISEAEDKFCGKCGTKLD